MNIHKNARLTPLGRERVVREVLSGQTPAAAETERCSASQAISAWWIEVNTGLWVIIGVGELRAGLASSSSGAEVRSSGRNPPSSHHRP